MEVNCKKCFFKVQCLYVNECNADNNGNYQDPCHLYIPASFVGDSIKTHQDRTGFFDAKDFNLWLEAYRDEWRLYANE